MSSAYSSTAASSHFAPSTIGPPWPFDDPHQSIPTILSKWTYTYMNPILKRGATQEKRPSTRRLSRISNPSNVEDDEPSPPPSQELSSAHLYRAPESMKASYLQPKFNRIYAEEGGKLISTLWRIALPSFAPAGVCQFVTVLAQVAVPLFVWRLLRILEDNPSENVFSQSILYVVLILLVDVVNALALNRQRFLAMQSGVTIRVAIIGAIYDRVLRLTPAGKMGLTSGSVTNLFAIDSQKLFEVTAEGHLLWSAPLSMILVAILLIVIVGPSMAVGIVLLLLFAPIVQKISNKMMDIRKHRVKKTDHRVEIVNAMLQGIKVTKLNNYENRYIAKIEQVRNEELALLRQELYVWSMVMAVQFISPVVASIGAFAAYVFAGNVLTTADAFTALLLFNALRFPINYASRLIGKLAQARESTRRISQFMRREAMPSREQAQTPHRESSSQSCNGMSSLNNIAEDESMKESLSLPIDGSPCHSLEHVDDCELLKIKDGMFRIGSNATAELPWDTPSSGEDDNGFIVKGINISVGAGQILAIVGPVGAGKSTIINAIIGEAAVSPNSKVETHGKVAYASQVAFILNATIRDNILFGNEFDAKRYHQVLDDCCLRADIDQLAAADLTEIGERGVTLSGGQKQRISLARVVYSNPAIALFDDPLSALDAGTNRKVFDRLFKQSGNKLLSNTAVVLVTHASHFLHRVDKIMVVVDGGVSFLGSWVELSKFNASDQKSKMAIESIQNAVQEDGEDVQEEQTRVSSNHSILTNTELASYKRKANMHQNVTEALMSREERQHGKTRLWTWTLWFREAGGLVFTAGVLTVFALEKLFYFATEWWMTQWTSAAYQPIAFLGIEFPAQSDGVYAQHGYIVVYAVFMLLGFICAFLRTVWIVYGGVKCSRNLYSSMTTSVLHAPMLFFETTPMGRLLNRFTYDAEILDITLVWSMSMLLISFSWFLTGIIVMVAILPWMILALIPVCGCYWAIQQHYRKSGADLQRIDALSRSPLQAMLAEGIEGSATIRSFQKEEMFTQRFHSFVNRNVSAVLNFISAQRWLGIRIELMGVSIVFVATMLVIIFNEVFGLSAGLVALLIRWSSSLTVSLSFFMENVAEAEGAITAIERIKMMSEETPQEPNFERKLDMNDSWPSRGELEFKDVQMRYRPLLPPALDGLSFRVEAGQHCGVVGRTGAGKSSISVAMFRLTEIDAGSIIVDGVDLSTLGLSDVRGKPNGIAIIPQDPVLFAGTMRECLDPFNTCSDEKLLEALLSVRMLGPGKGKEFLDTHVEEGGANYSVGERSLLVLARAMLARPKLLVMDEATANIDGETDTFIQKMLRTRFSDTTLITIAHRLDTIMDYDQVLVMSDGKAAEFGPPAKLLEQNGVFAELVNAAGEGAASLIAMAFKAAKEKELKQKHNDA